MPASPVVAGDFGGSVEGKSVYANYGRNYMRPYAFVPVTNIVASNLARFEAAGLTLQDVFDDWRLETSDNIDLGLRLQRDRLALTPSIFYAKHHDLLAVAYDPRVGLNYHPRNRS